MRKSIVKTLLSILLVAVMLVGGTLAYLVASDHEVLNTFRLAKVTTEIEEKGSTEIDKAAMVTNKSETSAVYVRAKVVVSSENVDPGLITVTEAQYNTSNEVGQENTPYWIPDEDGFYYYNAILQPGDSTEELFTGVTVDPSVPKTATFSVGIYQESVLAPADGTWSLTAAQAAFNKKG